MSAMSPNKPTSTYMGETARARHAFSAGLLAVGMLWGTGCSGATPRYPYAQEQNPATQEYTIGVSDHLRVTVWKNPELTTETRVRPDGIITLPLIGDVRADGQTPTELKQAITTPFGCFRQGRCCRGDRVGAGNRLLPGHGIRAMSCSPGCFHRGSTSAWRKRWRWQGD